MSERWIGVRAPFLEAPQWAELRLLAEKLGFSLAELDQPHAPVAQTDCEVLFGNFPPESLADCTALRWMQCSFAGVDVYCRPGVLPEGLLLTNSAGAYGVTIAEHIVCVLLMLMRRMPEYAAVVAAREWRLVGDVRSIYGSRITVVGMGDIGSNFGKRAHALGAAVTGVRRHPGETPDWAEAIYPTSRLTEAVAKADAVVFCVPGTVETKALCDAALLEAMPEGCYVINVGRGSAVDQTALLQALRSGRLAGAALDVAEPEPLPPEHPLWSAPNLLLTPHVSGNMSLDVTRRLVFQIFRDNLERYAAGRPLCHLVDQTAGY